MIEYRLVRQSIDHYIRGVFTGCKVWYVLQERETDHMNPLWHSLPVVMFEDLPESEQEEIYRVLK